MEETLSQARGADARAPLPASAHISRRRDGDHTSASGVPFPAVSGEKLPEEFAPTGPKRSRFPIQPAPAVRPRLFADEARFAARLALLAGGAELAAWIWFARLLAHRGPAWAALAFALCRVLRPLWAWLGTRLRRGAVAFALLAASLLVQGFAAMTFADALGAVAAALPAVADLCAVAVAGAVTVERRAAAYSWLDMAQGLGCGLGLAIGVAEPRLAPLLGTAALLVGSLGIPDLRDRGTPRSTWPVRVRLQILRTPLAGQLALLAAAGVLALALRLLAPPAAVGVGLFALGGLCAALPGAVARGAGEMERAVASSFAWSALAIGAGVGLACSVLA